MNELLNDRDARNAVVAQLVDHLVSGQYGRIAVMAPRSSVSPAQLRQAVLDYGRSLIPLPPSAHELIDHIAVAESRPPTWSVVVPLFTQEEGRSDLSLELELIDRGNGEYEAVVNDLHVL